MKFKTATPLEIALEGIGMDADRDNGGSYTRVRLTDAKGRIVQFRSQYGLTVEVPAPPRMEKRYRLHGVVCGIPVQHDFEQEYEARSARDDYRNKVRDPDDCNVTISEVEVEVPDE